MISIEGLSRAKVLAALYNAAKPQGMGFLHYNPLPMTEAEGQTLLKDTKTYFDYLQGRVMKIEIPGVNDEQVIDERLYDRDNGAGAAKNVIFALAYSQKEDSAAIQKQHEEGLPKKIQEAREMAGTRSKLRYEHGIPVYDLGADELAEPLKEAIDRL